MFINLSEAIPNNNPHAGHRDNYGTIIQSYNRVPVLVNMDTVKHIKRIDNDRSVLFFIDNSDMKVIETPEQINALLQTFIEQSVYGQNTETIIEAPRRRGRPPKVQNDEPAINDEQV